MKFNTDYLADKLGFKIKGSCFKKVSLDELKYNLFSYLEDYKKMNFSFINLPNKLVDISDGQYTYSLF